MLIRSGESELMVLIGRMRVSSHKLDRPVQREIQLLGGIATQVEINHLTRSPANRSVHVEPYISFKTNVGTVTVIYL